MPIIDAQETVGKLVALNPARGHVFERYGIDYCCGGGLPLQSACKQKGVDLKSVLEALFASDEKPAAEETNWNEASLTDLTDHIEQTHHGFVRSQLPRLRSLLDKVVTAHGNSHPEVAEARRVFGALEAELVSHMHKEENILFPWCRKLESGPGGDFGFSIGRPIEVMEAEHDSAGAALATLRELMSGYVIPDDARNTYRVLLEGLAAFERDLHIHIHKENNILFTRALTKELGRA